MAQDGGLLVPHYVPDCKDVYKDWRNLSFHELAYEIASRYAPAHPERTGAVASQRAPGGGGRYTGDEIPEADLRSLMRRSYVNFADQQDPVPTKAVGDLHIMELFHGPTFAFKDVALQALGARNATRRRKCDAAAQSKPKIRAAQSKPTLRKSG